MNNGEFVDTLVIGGGQAGLAAGFYLTRRGVDFIILDAESRTGETWRKRWDSLRLFTPAKYSSLPGLSFPAEPFYFPTRNEVADYLQVYAEKYKLPVQFNTRVKSIARDGNQYRVDARSRLFSTSKVIVATGAYQKPAIPPWAGELDKDIKQLHSNAYQNPSQIPSGNVLVVGAGNSGAEIAFELANAGHQVWLSGRDVGRIPADTLGRFFGGRPYWWLVSRVLSMSNPLGRKMRKSALHKGTPLIRINPREIGEAGVQRCLRTAGAKDGRPQIEDGQVLEVKSVIWATGFHYDFSWINLPIFDENGYPQHVRGVVPQAAGLYFLGLHFQHSLSSALIGGVGADADYILHHMPAALANRDSWLN
jgi:putative flavoprotein involved in K+ transport